MTNEEFYATMLAASTLGEALAATEAYAEATTSARWTPVGARENNCGTIQASADPGRALVERVTNGVDAVLEQEHALHGGRPDCRTPGQAAAAWLNVPEGGLSKMTQQQRQVLAKRVTITLLPGDTKSARILDIRDLGTGLTAAQIPDTILSLNSGNKMKKHYLAGTYGQGGSSTFAACTLSFIASRAQRSDAIAFTVVRFQDLPPEEFKTGHYVYLVVNGEVPTAAYGRDFAPGTLVRHFGYGLSAYASPLGPGSVYGLLNSTLFHPVMPVWFDNRVHNYRRVIKGSRNALNGAVDEGDDAIGGPSLSHHIPMLYIPVDDWGRVGVEYWLLEKPKKSNAKPSAAFVNPAKPVLLTLNGQAQAEMSVTLVKKEAELPYLAQRLICHIDCNSLAPAALRQLFVSNREAARSGAILGTIRRELVNLLKSDDELIRLNDEARNETMKERDEEAVLEARKAVAKLLKMQGIDVADVPVGSTLETKKVQNEPDEERTPRSTRSRRLTPASIDLHEPPTYIRIVWDAGAEIPFHPEQRRYIRIETDAQSSYHDATNPHNSRVNFIVTDGEVAFRASTPLQGGRMRALFECPPSAKIDGKGTIKVDLSCPGLSVLSDQREFLIVSPPKAKEDEKKISLPPFDFERVEYGSEPWNNLAWPDDVAEIASSAENDHGVHRVYYSVDFPQFKSRFATFERKNSQLAKTFEKRYAVWLVVHSLLYEHQQRGKPGVESDGDEERQAEAERAERIRVATLSAMIAAKEVLIAEASGSAQEIDDT